MKNLLRGFLASVSMFSAVPVPKQDWQPDTLRYILLFFPLTGILIGGIWAAALYALNLARFNELLQAFILMLTPFLLTGFLHMDGFCDTCDAIFSGRELDAKRKILKDPNLGVFGGCALSLTLLLWYICSLSLLNKSEVAPLIMCMTFSSRLVAAIAVINLKGISSNGLGALFKEHSKGFDNILILLQLLAALIISYFVEGKIGILLLCVVITSTSLAALYSYRNLEGFSGDLAGFSIICGETAGMVLLACL